MNTDFLSPLCLGVDPFTLGGDGAQAFPNTVQLLNPNRTGMLVDEVRFCVGDDTDRTQFLTTQVQLGLGATPLTNQFIPLKSFVPLYFNALNDLTLTWHLARPMYVPPDVQLHVGFRRKIPPGLLAPVDTNQLWGFSTMGRSMPAGMAIPEKIYVPWACATSCYSEDVPFISGDADIGNPFDEPLNVDYFTGWNANVDVGFASTSMLKAPFTFQATLSNGKVFARDPIPFSALFPPDRPMLRMRALLQPKEFISVVLDVPQPVPPDNLTLNFTTVGMTGWRELKTPLGALP